MLYGSYARGDYDGESAIDLLVLLNDNEVSMITDVFTLTLQAILPPQ